MSREKDTYSYGRKKLQHIINLLKGKTIPLQTWTDPEGSRSLRLTDFKIIGA
jgi:hypothetical protein